MKKTIALAAAALSLAAASPSPASADSGIKVGVLTCHVEGGVGFIIGSSKDVECLFKGSGGRR